MDKHCRDGTCYWCEIVQDTEQQFCLPCFVRKLPCVFKTPNLWFCNFSEPSEVPDEVPWVIILDQVEVWMTENSGKSLISMRLKDKCHNHSPVSLNSLVGFFQDFAWHRWHIINWCQRTSVSVLPMRRVQLAPQFCQSLTCVMNSLPGNFPANGSPVLHQGRKLEEVTWLSTAARDYGWYLLLHR